MKLLSNKDIISINIQSQQIFSWISESIKINQYYRQKQV